ncbi:hypothetical protein ACN083_04920 [Rothia sp. CCM 9418]|uniref:hypothetical protein n=1 Tax=Rothia sp. CCM 9418 TaxID=3402661 RepID=UPI003AE48A81
MSSSLLLCHSGLVHTPVDPEATAVLIDGANIEWVGSEAGARSLYDSRMQRVDMGGRLLCAAFSLGMARVSTVIEAETLTRHLLEHGYGGVTYNVPADIFDEVSSLLSRVGVHGYLYCEVNSLGEVESLSRGVDRISLSATCLELEEILEVAASRNYHLSVHVEGEGEYQPFIKRLVDQELHHFPSIRCDGVRYLSQESIMQCVEYKISLGFTCYVNEDVHRSLSAAISSGAVTFCGSDPNSSMPEILGWNLIHQFMEHNTPEISVTSRGMFHTLTRSVYRSLGEPSSFHGQLVPSTPADCALWEITSLESPQNQGIAQNWSTDPRSRVPSLPYLQEANLPVLSSLYIGGQLILSKSSAKSWPRLT